MQDDTVAYLASEALGDHLAEDQHQQGGGAGGDGRPVVLKQVQAQDGGKARTAQIDDVVADEDGCQRLVKPVGDPQSVFGPPAAAVNERFEPDGVG